MAQANAINWVQETLQKQKSTLQERFVMKETDGPDGFGFCLTDKQDFSNPYQVTGFSTKKAAKHAAFLLCWQSWQARGLAAAGIGQGTRHHQPQAAAQRSQQPSSPALSYSAQRLGTDSARWFRTCSSLQNELALAHNCLGGGDSGPSAEATSASDGGCDPRTATLARLSLQAVQASAALLEALRNLSSASAATYGSCLDPAAANGADPVPLLLDGGAVGHWPAQPSALLRQAQGVSEGGPGHGLTTIPSLPAPPPTAATMASSSDPPTDPRLKRPRADGLGVDLRG
jgi:hypothetical protein